VMSFIVLKSILAETEFVFSRFISNSWISLNINHQRFVSEGSSLPSGNDLRVVYLDGEKYKELEMNLENTNSVSAKIDFKTINDITAGDNDNKYFLYYNNPEAKKYSQSTNEVATFKVDYFVTYSKEQLPRLVAQTSRRWVLKDDPDPRSFVFSIEPNLDENTNIENITYEIIGVKRTGTLEETTSSFYETTVKVKDLPAGTYNIQASATMINSALQIKSRKVKFYVSYPLLVTWTQDWEGFDVSEQYLSDMERISSEHSLPITHFFNPRIYIAGDLSAQRKQRMTSWILDRQNKGDEIALHLHMHYDLVSATGVDVRTQPSWGGRENGHDVLTSAYSYQEMKQILTWSKQQFQQNGLGTPTSFRAGGWFANLDTLSALQDTGFLLDSSGRTAYSWGPNQEQGFWQLGSTTRPYKPSSHNQNTSTPAPTLSIWEFPNNGSDSWSYKTEDLIQRFNDNYRGGPLSEKQVITYLSHPHWFNTDKPKIEQTFNYIDQFTYSRDSGPVKYVTLEQARITWEKYAD
ncbi:MAG TPA: DUF2334 domain-containing protein, partial [bacterium]|nr:DUF2334 domain-containing protein [bacterium]